MSTLTSSGLSVRWYPEATRSRATSMKTIRFGNATEEIAIFKSWPIVQITDTSKEAEITRVRDSHLPTFQDPIFSRVVFPGAFSDIELPYDTNAHQQFCVRVGGVPNDSSSSGTNATGRLQVVHGQLGSGNIILALQQPCLEVPGQFPSIPWPCNNDTIKDAKFKRTTGSQDILIDTECKPGESHCGRSAIESHRATDKSASSGDNPVSFSSESVGHETPEQILAPALKAGPGFFRSEVYGVELELEEGSLEQDAHAPVTISPHLRFVVRQTEYQGRTRSEEFLAMPFVSGPETVVLRKDKPALLRFFLGFAEDFLSEDVTDPQIADEAIKKTVREWYTPLSSPDGKGDWVSLEPYAVTYRHEGKYKEVWVETPVRHFSIIANGVKIDIPSYKHDGDSEAPYYYEPMGWLRKATRMRAPNPMIRLGNATKNYAIFTSWPIIQTTEAIDEAGLRIRAGNAVAEGEVSGRKRSEVRGSQLPTFQVPKTTVVPSGTFVDCELPCDITAHKQMHVRVGVLKNLSSSDPEATGKLQLLDDKLVSGNMVLVLRQPRLSTPSQFPSIPWPCDDESIINAKGPTKHNWSSLTANSME